VPPSCGPLSGITLGLERMTTTHLVVLAIDLSDMPLAQLRRLAEQAEAGIGVVPVTPEHFEPLAAIYPKEAERIAQSCLSSGQFAMHKFAAELLKLGLLKKYRLAEAERAFYRNLNTPADVERTAQ
jgi:molybdopterin-guanine dinucleotide biosynthesis protein A